MTQVVTEEKNIWFCGHFRCFWDINCNNFGMNGHSAGVPTQSRAQKADWDLTKDLTKVKQTSKRLK